MPTLQEALIRHGPDYLKHFGDTMPKWHRRALGRLMACRTEAAGRLYHECETCGTWQVVPASCGHRACAQCGLHKARQWEARQQARRLPVAYVMITFTVPEPLREVFRRHQKTCYDMLMQESGGTLREIANDPKLLGGEIGATGVLHTWKRDLGYHVHVHYLLPAGAWAAEAKKWITPKKAGYFLPSAVLATRMRNRCRDRLKAEHPDIWKGVPHGAWKRAWNVNVQFVGKGEKAFGYLARYVQSTAMRNRRLVAVTERTVTYRWTDRRTGEPRHATVSGREFIRRFLQHVLPKGVVRVRHLGFLSAAAKKTFAAVQAALGAAPMPPPAAADAEMAAAAATAATETPGESIAPPASGKVCCAKCQRIMKFHEFRTAARPGDPAALDPTKRREPKPAQPPPERPQSSSLLPPFHFPRGPPVAERSIRSTAMTP